MMIMMMMMAMRDELHIHSLRKRMTNKCVLGSAEVLHIFDPVL